MAAFAKLSEAERERLEVLAEEASEVAQQAMKICRHGYMTVDYFTGKAYDNQVILMDELLELWTIMERMTFHGDIRKLDYNSTGAIWKNKLRYMHHQPPFHDPREPPMGYEGVKRSNAGYAGWDDFFKGKSRDKYPFPANRPDLKKDWEEGWDAAKQSKEKPDDGDTSQS